MLAACCITDFCLSTRADLVNAATAVIVADALAFAGIPLALYGVSAGLLQWIVPQVEDTFNYPYQSSHELR